MTVNNNNCEACGQTLPPTLDPKPAQEPAQEPAGRDVFDKRAQGGGPEPAPTQAWTLGPESLDGFNHEYTELVKQLPLSARIKLASRLEKAGIARDAVGDSVLLPLNAAVAAQVRRRTVAKASSAAKRLAVKEAKA